MQSIDLNVGGGGGGGPVAISDLTDATRTNTVMVAWPNRQQLSVNLSSATGATSASRAIEIVETTQGVGSASLFTVRQTNPNSAAVLVDIYPRNATISAFRINPTGNIEISYTIYPAIASAQIRANWLTSGAAIGVAIPALPTAAPGGYLRHNGSALVWQNPVTGAFADDTAAATAGVAIGAMYYQPNGTVVVRLT